MKKFYHKLITLKKINEKRIKIKLANAQNNN